jgi:hypothetical protein
MYELYEAQTSDEMLLPKRREGIIRVAAVGAVVYDVFVAPPAHAAGSKITSKAHTAVLDAAYGSAPISFETPSLAFESRFQVRLCFSTMQLSSCSAFVKLCPPPLPPSPLNSAETCGVLLVSARRCTNYS